MDRRQFIKAGATGIGAVGLGGLTTSACAPAAGPSESAGAFHLGVVSGLHSPTEVVLWTRINPVDAPGVNSVTCTVATDPAITDVVATATAPVSALADNCVKVLVGGLVADTSYWYRFDTGAQLSPVGRARTLPAPWSSPPSLKLAFASCQAYSNGYYGAWRDIATRDLDAVLFLGDYIYEAPDIQLLGNVRPDYADEALTLDQYRAKYRLYRSDVDIRAAHAAHPLVPVWDDHEVFNDHDAGQLAQQPARQAAAYQAWFEYMPVMPISGSRIYRSLQWGDLGEVFMLDTRQYRGPHLPVGPLGATLLAASYAAPDRTILGPEQKAWLLGGLDAAQIEGRTWKIIGNQVMIAPIRVTDLDTPQNRAVDPTLPRHAGLYTNMDSWDGFSHERDEVLAHLGGNGIDNTLFVTGDYHAFFAGPLRQDFDDPASPVVAHDFCAAGISSKPFNPFEFLVGGGGPPATEPPFDHISYTENGYGLVEATPSSLEVTFVGGNATYRGAAFRPRIRWTLTPGDPNATITHL